jgi:hypothetical protein
MSGKADCFEHAPIGSFFLTLETEFSTIATARPAPTPSARSSPSSRASSTKPGFTPPSEVSPIEMEPKQTKNDHLGRQYCRAGLSERELRKSEYHDPESVGVEVPDKRMNRTRDCFPSDDLGNPRIRTRNCPSGYTEQTEFCHGSIRLFQCLLLGVCLVNALSNFISGRMSPRIDTFPIGMLVGALLMLCLVWAYNTPP